MALGHYLLGVNMLTKELTKKESQERARVARMWLQLRKNNLLSQVRLADILGISRRTVQLIEAGEVSPRFSTQRKFRDYAEKIKREHARESQRESGWAA
jgi:DNA-binding XRE family transcriptional regulator